VKIISTISVLPFFWLLPTLVNSADVIIKKRSPDQVLLIVNANSPVSRAQKLEEILQTFLIWASSQ
jgi:hypothetical protein